MNTREIGMRIAELRKEKGLTQEQLAAVLYVTEKAVSKWECGKGIPDLINLRKIAAFFSVSLEELLADTGTENREGSREEGDISMQAVAEENVAIASFIHSYEDIVVYSDRLSRDSINRLAEEYRDTILQFEEILYLLDYLAPETLQMLCLYHKDKITPETDLSVLWGRIDESSMALLLKYQQEG